MGFNSGFKGLKILPRLRRQKLNVINRSLLFQRPVLFTERLSSITLTITATRDEKCVVRKYQAFREVLKWQEKITTSRQSPGHKVSGMLGKRRVGPNYKITDMLKYEKK